MSIPLAARREIFRHLHKAGCFAIPNPWDVGSARYLKFLGFKALATTSSGYAWSQGRADNAMPLDSVLDHLAQIVAATDLPVNADFEGGFADDPAGVAENVTRAVATGVSGLSIEDSTGNTGSPLYGMPLAVERIKAARAAIDATGTGVVLTGRAECFLVGRPDLKETTSRLVAYAEAGADCLYAPGLRTKQEIAAVVSAVAPKPVNVLMGSPGLTVADLTELGVRRISVGGALARMAWAGFMQAAREIAEHGSFAAFGRAVPHKEIDGLFKDSPAE